MAIPGFKPKKGEVLADGHLLRAWIDFIFGFENKKGDVLDHWIAFADHLKFPPQEFYEAIEKELAARNEENRELLKMKIEMIRHQLASERARSRPEFAN